MVIQNVIFVNLVLEYPLEVVMIIQFQLIQIVQELMILPTISTLFQLAQIIHAQVMNLINANHALEIQDVDFVYLPQDVN